MNHLPGRTVARTLLAFFLLLIPTAGSGFDLFEVFAVPEMPIVLQSPAWASRTTSLRVAQTFEEVYRQWTGDRETTRFDGNRSRAGLYFQILDRLGVGYSQSLAAHQNLMNDDKGRAESFDLEGGETWSKAELQAMLGHSRLSLVSWKSADAVEGKYQLERSIAKALGTQPRTYFDTTSVGRTLRWYSGESSRWSCLLERETAEYAHRIFTGGARMYLEVPFSRTNESRLLEIGYKGFGRFRPYFRRWNLKDSGSGTSTKDLKFIFGHTAGEIDLTSNALGIARTGKYPWFAEFQRLHIDSNVSISNNLITLEALFLFGTNEVINRELLEPADPWGFRIGCGFKTNHRWEGSAQYAHTRLALTRISKTEKITNMRRKQETDSSEERHELALHRLRLEGRRPDRCGSWNLGAALLVPQVISTEKAAAAGGAAAPTPGPSGGGAPSPEKKVRGGWQLTVEREFRL